MKALVIAGNDETARALDEWLRQLGIESRAARTAEAARVALERDEPQVVLSCRGILGAEDDERLGGLVEAKGACWLRVVQQRIPARPAAGEVAVSGRPPRVTGALGMVGASPAMATLYTAILRVARSSAPIFVTGETGTGKELVVEAVHRLGGRARGPYVAVNCGAIPRELFESELFGHERGSFTGANRRRRGLFEQAEGGTLFLDELTEMPLELQVKLLRVIESNVLTRVGGQERIRFDARIVAASNSDPRRAVLEGTLREDLYYRLFVLPIELPPLRERDADLDLLTDSILARLDGDESTPTELSSRGRRALRERPWRGNVRELRSVLERAFLVSDGYVRESAILHGTLPRPAARCGSLNIEVGMSLAQLQRAMIQATLDQVAGCKSRAANLLGISLSTLSKRLELYRTGSDAAPRTEEVSPRRGSGELASARGASAKVRGPSEPIPRRLHAGRASDTAPDQPPARKVGATRRARMACS